MGSPAVKSAMTDLSGDNPLKGAMWSTPPSLALTVSLLFHYLPSASIGKCFWGIRPYGSSPASGPTSLFSFTFLPILHTPFPSDQTLLIHVSGALLTLLLHLGVPLPTLPTTEHLLILQGSAQHPLLCDKVLSVGFPESHRLQFEGTLRVV